MCCLLKTRDKLNHPFHTRSPASDSSEKRLHFSHQHIASKHQQHHVSNYTCCPRCYTYYKMYFETPVLTWMPSPQPAVTLTFNP